jgi:hypothetical protein
MPPALLLLSSLVLPLPATQLLVLLLPVSLAFSPCYKRYIMDDPVISDFLCIIIARTEKA